MDFDQILARLAVALGIGLLIGLERGWATREAAPGSRAAGIRTFSLYGLLGGIVAATAQATGSPAGAGLVLGFAFAVYAVIVALFEREANRAAQTYSATTTIAALLTFILAAYGVIGDMRAAGAAAVAVAAILAARQGIHDLVERMTWPELRSTLVLLAMSVIVLPIVPDTPIGPGGGVNPREVWLIAVVLAGVSFLGYGAVKLFGTERGLLLGALAGGLVSSTAVTLTSARRAAAGEATPRLLAAAVSTSTAISFMRVMAVASALNPTLLAWVAPPLTAAVMVAAGHAAVAFLWAGKQGEKASPAEFNNPFSFWPVVGFAVFLGLVILFGRYIGETFGAQGALIGAAGLGLADVDAVTVSMARLAPAPLSELAASAAILVAVLSNTASKLAIAASVGRGAFAVQVAVMTVACWIAGAIGLWLATVVWAV
ncbi:MAG: DUF4010 domain-containing protein [Pseudolabrys sp.]|nr:DUF4010 domain-containing protein [Pseudolabrys sp.]